VNELHSK